MVPNQAINTQRSSFQEGSAEDGVLFLTAVESCPEASLPSPIDDSVETSKALQWEAYKSLHSLLAEFGIENMKGLHRSYIMCEFSRLWIQPATTAQALTEQEAAREDEVDRLEAALVQENSWVYHMRESVKGVEAKLSSACQELRRSAVHVQHVVEAREERAVALLAAQTAEAEVERLTKIVADLQSELLSVSPPFSWNVATAILTEFVLNFQDQVPNLLSLLEVYKQIFTGGGGGGNWSLFPLFCSLPFLSRWATLNDLQSCTSLPFWGFISIFSTFLLL
ncbi:hypothetical protein LIER_27911 [Lithospermum erythrorhizon]|uniref:Uncharacterized protein n=1 Tax=Lithospermum erythrorhizon TaxID=34254 RepID=A0AAV3RDP4_LITER